MTYRQADDPARRGERRAEALGFEPVHVGSYPESTLRCLVYQEDGLVKARINEAHGDSEAWDHAAYHASAGVDGLGFVCVVGVPCGYVGDLTYLEVLARDGV